MKTPGGRGELSLSGPYLAFARGRWRGRGVFLPLPDSPGPSSPSPADPGLAPSSRRGRPSPPRAVEAALRLRPPRGRSPPPRFSCPSGAAASFPQRHTGPAGPASSPGSLNRRLGGPDPAAGSRAGIPVPPPPPPPRAALSPLRLRGEARGAAALSRLSSSPAAGHECPVPHSSDGPLPHRPRRSWGLRSRPPTSTTPFSPFSAFQRPPSRLRPRSSRPQASTASRPALRLPFRPNSS